MQESAGWGPQEEDGRMMGQPWNARCPSAQWTKLRAAFCPLDKHAREGKGEGGHLRTNWLF